jgi:hypothetical protein
MSTTPDSNESPLPTLVMVPDREDVPCKPELMERDKFYYFADLIFLVCPSTFV